MSERTCERKGCTIALNGRKDTARFCSDYCRHADFIAKHPGYRQKRQETDERAKSRHVPRRASREGKGTRSYFTLADFDHGGRLNLSGLRKVTEARKRLEGAA